MRRSPLVRALAASGGSALFVALLASAGWLAAGSAGVWSTCRVLDLAAGARFVGFFWFGHISALLDLLPPACREGSRYEVGAVLRAVQFALACRNVVIVAMTVAAAICFNEALRPPRGFGADSRPRPRARG